MTNKVMQFVDTRYGIMQCRVCGNCHIPLILSGGRLKRGSWQCLNGCEKEPTGEAEKS